MKHDHDSADSDSEEEILVFAEFEKNVNLDMYRNVHALGVDSKNPIIQLDDTFFTGTYEPSLGTYMFFEEDATIKPRDPLYDKIPDKNLKFSHKTMKFMRMEHAYVTSKEGIDKPMSQTQSVDDDIEFVKFNSIQEATNKFKTALMADQQTHSDHEKPSIVVEVPSQDSNENPDIVVEPHQKNKNPKLAVEAMEIG